MRSSSGRPDAWYFLAIETTRRRLDCTNVRSAFSPSRDARRSSRLRAGVSAALGLELEPGGVAGLDGLGKADLVVLGEQGYCPMSVRYSRTRSSSSRSTRSLGKARMPTVVSLRLGCHLARPGCAYDTGPVKGNNERAQKRDVPARVVPTPARTPRYLRVGTAVSQKGLVATGHLALSGGSSGARVGGSNVD